MPDAIRLLHMRELLEREPNGSDTIVPMSSSSVKLFLVAYLNTILLFGDIA